MKKLMIATSALVLGALLSVSACSSQQAEPAAPTEQTAATEPIIGEWRMTELEAGTEGNLQAVPYSGKLIFTEAGTLSVQAMNPDLDAPDTAYTVQSYESYYGPVVIDSAAGTFEIEVESAATRDLITQKLTRNFEISDDTLVLTPVDPTEGWRVSYERMVG